MRRPALMALLGCFFLAAAGCSDDEPAPTADTGVPAGNGICIQTEFIDHSEIPNDNTIIFYMKGGVMWKNDLRFTCTSLKSEGGFAFVTELPEVCSNSQTIRVLRSGILCELGQFSPMTPALPPAPADAGK